MSEQAVMDRSAALLVEVALLREAYREICGALVVGHSGERLASECAYRVGHSVREHGISMRSPLEFILRPYLNPGEAVPPPGAAGQAVLDAGDQLAHWLQIWINHHSENTWCYSEAALARWRQARAGSSSGGAEGGVT